MQEKDFVLRKSAGKQEHAKKYQERKFRKLIAVQAGAQDGAKGKKTKTAASRVERPSMVGGWVLSKHKAAKQQNLVSKILITIKSKKYCERGFFQ